MHGCPQQLLKIIARRSGRLILSSFSEASQTMLPSVLLPIGLAVIGALARNATNTTSLIEELVVAPDHVDRVADLPYDSEVSSVTR